jgi:hypothetical protein
MRRVDDNPKPVKKIILSDDKPKLRIALVVILVLFGVSAFAYGIYSSRQSENGWTAISVSSSADTNCGDEFIFNYRLGENGISATAENKLLTTLYTEAMVNAYQNFDKDTFHGSLHNVYDINLRVNEVVRVEDILYQAFEACAEYGVRNIFLAPVYELYDSIFYCNEDWETESFDAYQNDELAKYYAQVAAYAGDSSQVDIELLGDNHIRLFVSDEYLGFAEEEGITSFVDFYWMKNAFIIDYIADVMIENGYTNGYISSYDGFTRNLDESGTQYAFPVYNREGNVVSLKGNFSYVGPMTIVSLRDYPINSQDYMHYYELENGDIRNPYVDITDGLTRTATENLVAYSKDISCAELLLQLIPIYVTDTFDTDVVDKLADKGVYAVWFENGHISYSDVGFANDYK